MPNGEWTLHPTKRSDPESLRTKKDIYVSITITGSKTLVSRLLVSEAVIRPSSQCFGTDMVYYISTVLLPSLSRSLWYVDY